MKEFHIDFGSWIIEANSKEEAETKANNMILTGEAVPTISGIEEH